MGSNIEKKQVMKSSFACEMEKQYIEENLIFFIEKEEKSSRTNLGNRWHIHDDSEAQLRYLLVDYIIEHFNLYELFIIFFRQDCYLINPNIITEARQRAIENINDDDSFTPEEVKRLKRKVWDVNPILFGLILELIHLSNLFWDCEKEDYVLPTFG
jgi:hypothetical protein